MKAFPFLVLCASLLAGCSSLKRTDPTQFYVLSSLEVPAAASPRFGGLLFVAPVEVASHLDNPAIAVRRGTNRVEFAQHHHWAQPLRDNVTQVLRENLARRLGTEHVHPLGRQRPRGAFIALEARLDQFEFMEQKQGILSATWQLTNGESGKPKLIRTTRIEKPLPASPGDFGSQVAILNETLAELSREIAAALLELPPLDK